MPVPRAAFVTGNAFGARVRSIIQVVIILFLSLLLGLDIRWNPINILMSMLAVILGAAFFSSLSMALVAAVKSRERFMGIGQVITMPLFFASSAIYPIQIMPHWLQIVARLNPLSYVVELLRGYLVNSSVPLTGEAWFILLIATVIMQIISGILFPYIVI